MVAKVASMRTARRARGMMTKGRRARGTALQKPATVLHTVRLLKQVPQVFAYRQGD